MTEPRKFLQHNKVNKEEHVQMDIHDNQKCPDCLSTSIETEWADEALEYGNKQPVTVLWVKIPVRKCKNCGLLYTDEQTEQIQQDAVSNHLKMKEQA